MFKKIKKIINIKNKFYQKQELASTPLCLC